jgi:hypothetical protein
MKINIRPPVYTIEDIQIARRVGLRAQIQYENAKNCKETFLKILCLILAISLMIGLIVAVFHVVKGI